MDRIGEALAENDEQRLETYLANLRGRAEQLAAPPAVLFAKQLGDAGLDENRFLSVLSEIKEDRRIKKTDLQQIVER